MRLLKVSGNVTMQTVLDANIFIKTNMFTIKVERIAVVMFIVLTEIKIR